MYIYRLFVLIFLFCASISHAQLKLEDLEKKVKEISHLEDPHEKEYQLAEFEKIFTTFLKTYNEDATIADSSYIQITKSSDSKYKVYYYNVYREGIVYRLDWYVVYGDVYNRQVIHFADKTFSHKDKRGVGEFRLHLSRLSEGDLDLYPLTFSFKADGKIYHQFRDIATICMFEQFKYRETKKQKVDLNDSILQRMRILWDSKEYFNDYFKGISRISTLISDDKRVKICTWNIPLENSTNLFFGAVVCKNKEGEIKVYELNDDSEKMRSPEKAILSPHKWYGAVYYDIISIKDKSLGTYYMLIGFKPNDEMTKKKVVDPLIVMENVTPKFGHAIFQQNRVVDKRLVFEYAASANMMLKYEKHNQRFVLDHLSPPSSLYKGNYRLYGPDFSYDSYVLEKGKWVLYKDVDVRTSENH